MRPLTSTLRAAQQSASTVPQLRVRLFDRDVGAVRLRWQRLYTGTEPDGPCAVAVPADGSLLRARIDLAAGALTRQRVANPGPASDFTNWTSVATVAVGPRVGIAAAGTGALLVSVRTDGVTVDVRESTDPGATYPTTTLVATAAASVTAVACAMQADGSAAALYAEGGTVYAVTRTATGAWRAPVAWSQSLATINGLAAFFEVDYNVLVSGTNAAGEAGVWSLPVHGFLGHLIGAACPCRGGVHDRLSGGDEWSERAAGGARSLLVATQGRGGAEAAARRGARRALARARGDRSDAGAVA